MIRGNKVGLKGQTKRSKTESSYHSMTRGNKQTSKATQKYGAVTRPGNLGQPSAGTRGTRDI
jgi:hypothetical protein